MIDSLIKGTTMPYSDKSGSVGVNSGFMGGKRSSGDKSLPQCKKRKKAHKWPKKRYPESAGGRGGRCKAKRRVRTKPEAPFNSTQFIMNEHDNLNESDLSANRPRRQRDSSLSMESEEVEDYAYCSSPEEEEFMTKQFWYAYEDFHAERLDAMSKSQLIQEYFSLEERVTLLEKELSAAREADRRRIRDSSPADDDEEEETVPGEVPVDAETATKIEVFRNEIQKLEEENERLREQNLLLRRNHCSRRGSSSSSSSSGSSSNSSSSSDSSSSDSSSADSEDEGVEGSGAVVKVFPTERSRCVSDEELEISGTCLGASESYGPDSGIASSEGTVSSASSGEDAIGKEEGKPPNLPEEGKREVVT